MYSLLLAIIYIAFISLGLPDSLLGSSWPVMQAELGVPLSYAGGISAIISLGTIISSLMSDYLTKKLNVGKVTALSVGMTAAALLGFSCSHSFWSLCLWAIPYGLGAGAVDAALNNYVALHYSSRHMSWLHAFWGIGVSISPYIMSFCLSRNLGWHMGYRSISILQIVLTAVLFLSLPLWKNAKSGDEEKGSSVTLKTAIKISGVPLCLLMFFCFCALEATAGLWASSYILDVRGASAETAASLAALFYIGETVGRILNGFAADKFGDKAMIKTGIYVMLIGCAMMLLPIDNNIPSFAGLIILGLGAAPVYPCVIHSTPYNFGKENSQALVGVQMASAYTGTTLMPPLFGIIAEHISLSLYPVYLLIFAAVMLTASHFMYKKIENHRLF